MDVEKLKYYAEELDTAIRRYRDKNTDVDWLANFPPLQHAIEDAKAGRLRKPVKLGHDRYVMESSIPGIKEVSHPLACFSLLAEGLTLPKDQAQE